MRWVVNWHLWSASHVTTRLTFRHSFGQGWQGTLLNFRRKIVFTRSSNTLYASLLLKRATKAPYLRSVLRWWIV